MYGSLLNLQRSVAAVQKVADVLNRETKATERHELLHKHANKGHAVGSLREACSEGLVSFSFLEEIKFVNATFIYKSEIADQEPIKVLDKANATIPLSGSIISFISKGENTGSRTILRLLAGVLHPSGGIITVP